MVVPRIFGQSHRGLRGFTRIESECVQSNCTKCFGSARRGDFFFPRITLIDANQARASSRATRIVGGPETAAPCIFIFAFIRVFRGLNFGCAGAALQIRGLPRTRFNAGEAIRVHSWLRRKDRFGGRARTWQVVCSQSDPCYPCYPCYPWLKSPAFAAENASTNVGAASVPRWSGRQGPSHIPPKKEKAPGGFTFPALFSLRLELSLALRHAEL